MRLENEFEWASFANTTPGFGEHRLVKTAYELARAVRFELSTRGLDVETFDLQRLEKDFKIYCEKHSLSYEELVVPFNSEWPSSGGVHKSQFAEACERVIHDLWRAKVPGLRSEHATLTATLCKHLQDVTGDESFFLSCRTLAQWLNASKSHADRILQHLVTQRIIRKTKNGSLLRGKNGKTTASEFRYIGTSENEVGTHRPKDSFTHHQRISNPVGPSPDGGGGNFDLDPPNPLRNGGPLEAAVAREMMRLTIESKANGSPYDVIGPAIDSDPIPNTAGQFKCQGREGKCGNIVTGNFDPHSDAILCSDCFQYLRRANSDSTPGAFAKAWKQEARKFKQANVTPNEFKRSMAKICARFFEDGGPLTVNRIANVFDSQGGDATRKAIMGLLKEKMSHDQKMKVLEYRAEQFKE